MCAAFTALVCAGLICAAVLVPAPPGILPLLATACIGVPIVASWDLRVSIAVLRATAPARRGPGQRVGDARALAQLRRSLDRIPETEHPLGG